MDTSLEGLKEQAYTATSTASKLATDAPSMLNTLKSNLVGIFSKDNPVMQARDVALSDYLSTPARARADMLPTNMPLIEGRNLALSPTQQNAITTSRSAAALAPLAGLNEIIKAQYGNIGDMVSGAGDIYGAQITGAQNTATNLMEMYRLAIAEQEAKQAAAGSGGIDIASILAAILEASGGGGDKKKESLDDIFTLDQGAPRYFTGAGGKKYLINPDGTLNMTPVNENTGQPEINLSGLNLGNFNQTTKKKTSGLTMPGAASSMFGNSGLNISVPGFY